LAAAAKPANAAKPAMAATPHRLITPQQPPAGARAVVPPIPRKPAAPPAGVRVQRYQPELRPTAASGFWTRIRRVLFGMAEPETGA
jgi:hypothetical protein